MMKERVCRVGNIVYLLNQLNRHLFGSWLALVYSICLRNYAQTSDKVQYYYLICHALDLLLSDCINITVAVIIIAIIVCK